jgi:hypothetical protein
MISSCCSFVTLLPKSLSYIGSSVCLDGTDTNTTHNFRYKRTITVSFVIVMPGLIERLVGSIKPPVACCLSRSQREAYETSNELT